MSEMTLERLAELEETDAGAALRVMETEELFQLFTLARRALEQGNPHLGSEVRWVEWCKNCGHLGQPGEAIAQAGRESAQGGWVAEAEVLDVGIVGGKTEVTLRCSKGQGVAWGKLLYKTVRVLPPPPSDPSKGGR